MFVAGTKKLSATFAILMGAEKATAKRRWRTSPELGVPLAVPGWRWLDVSETGGRVNASEKVAKLRS